LSDREAAGRLVEGADVSKVPAGVDPDPGRHVRRPYSFALARMARPTLVHPKCARTGRMIFPGDPFVEGAGGLVYADEVARSLAESGEPLEACLDRLGPWLAHPDLEPETGDDPVLQEVVNGALT